ncbi:MAG: OOP family OmpA-OmpF porin [Planctomycetota bacterium]|jgi:OOP family OmpA-OmpF porin
MKKILLIAFMVMGLATMNAQNESARWAFGGGLSGVDFKAPMTKQYFNFKGVRASQRYFIGRYLNPSFNLKADFTFGKVWFPRVDGYPDVVAGMYDNKHIYDLGLNLEYKLNNGYILKETARVAPYLFTGIGTNFIVDYGKSEGTDINAFIPFGVGLNVRITDWLAVNLQSAYKLNLDNSFDYTQHTASLVLNLGGKPKGVEAKDLVTEVIDSDNDGVADLIDECPFAAGAENMFGCPDTDGDGMGDSRDDCPKVAGTLINKGCPATDTDGDGIPDDKDSCPSVKGEKRYAGCPDSDGDGIVDKYDKCPSEKGIASNNGCPMPVNDQYLNEQKTNTQIDHSNHNHTVKTDTNVNTTTTVVKQQAPNAGNLVEAITVYFGSASDVIPSSEKAKLAKVISLVNSNSGYKALIKGYTDKNGDDALNVNLSLKRATTVWQFLNSNGMSDDKADLFGFGEYNQQSSSDKGNRRVVIEIVK